MSKSVSNAEIEDVLSSIRRLVNEESRNTLSGRKPEAEPKSSRLVLTPALRVEEDAEDPESDPVILTDPVDALGEAAAEEAPETVEEPASEFVSQRTNPAEEAAPDPGAGSEAGAVDTSETDSAPDEVPAEQYLDDFGADLLTDEIIFAREAEMKARAEERSRLGAASEQAARDAEVADQDSSQEATGSDMADQTGSAPGSEAEPWKDPEATLYSAAGPDERSTDSERTDAAIPEDVRTAPLESKIEALEAAIAKTKDQWEPDGDVGDDYAGTHVETIQWEDHEDDQDSELADRAESQEIDVEPERVEQAVGSFDDAPAEADGFDEEALDVLASEESYLDEESLRELVADIVREELQGALGERITRNVRKLVRREIHRALVAQELE